MRFLLQNPAPWATVSTYPAGGFPWSGGPVRINPGSGILAAGVAPADQPAAQVLNYQLGVSGDALSDQAAIAAHAALQRWTRVTIPQVGSDSYYAVMGLRPRRTYDVNGERQRVPVAFGADTSDANKTRMARTNDGTVMEIVPGKISPAFTSFTYSAAGAPGEILLGQASPNIQYSTDHGHSWAALALASSGSAALGAHYALGLNRYFAATVHGDVFTGTTLASIASWPSVALPIPGGGSISGPVEFADDGGSNVCVVVNGVTIPSIYYSGDGGTTWTWVVNLLASTTANLTYNKALGLFVGWDDNGHVVTSPNGSTWVLASTGSTPANGFQSGYRTFASAGPAIVKTALNVITPGELEQWGIAYSFNLGVNWNYWYFAGLTVPHTLTIAGFNNRIYALDGASLYVSGQLGSPAAEL
jgi:hypothetical protein